MLMRERLLDPDTEVISNVETTQCRLHKLSRETVLSNSQDKDRVVEASLDKEGEREGSRRLHYGRRTSETCE